MIKTSFKSFLQFAKHFHDDATCRNHLEQVIWNNKPKCPHCETEKPYRLSDGKIFKCRNVECRKKFTVATGTTFEGTMLPLSTWFAAIYLLSSHKKGISSIQLCRDLGITQKTSWFLMQRIRKMMDDKNQSLLSNIVEVDETYVGGKSGKGTQGRSTKTKVPVVGLLERKGKVRTQVVKNTRGKTLFDIINAKVDRSATVMTDGWLGYKRVKNLNEHLVIDHSKGEYVIGNLHTNTIEGFWSLLKRGIIGIYHKMSVKHLQRYCIEFEFRYNTREYTDFERFGLVLKQSGGRLKYKELIN